MSAAWTERYPEEVGSIVSRTCPSCHGFGSIERGVDRCGHGIDGGRCTRCGGSGLVEERVKRDKEAPV